MELKEKREIIARYKRTEAIREALEDRIFATRATYTNARNKRERATGTCKKEYWLGIETRAKKKLENLAAQQKAYNRMRGATAALINTVADDELRAMLTDVYVGCMRYKEVSAKYGYSDSAIYIKLRKGLELIRFEEVTR